MDSKQQAELRNQKQRLLFLISAYLRYMYLSVSHLLATYWLSSIYYWYDTRGYFDTIQLLFIIQVSKQKMEAL